MDNLELVTYCGLYCDLCAQRGRIPAQAAALKESLTKEGWNDFGKYIFDSFGSFWELLSNFADKERSCSGCCQGGGNPECKIRDCAKEHNINTCPLCDQFPCDLINEFAITYPLVIPDGIRMKKIGLPAWIDEQKNRAKNGFIYADIRHSHYGTGSDDSK